MTGAESLPPLSLALIILSIAFLYASVGFGGASGYLAAMSLFAFSPQLMSSTALILNVLVSSIAFIAFYRARHFNPRLLWPFLLTSIPAAFLGGVIQVGTSTYLVLLYLSLTYVAVRMLLTRSGHGAEPPARKFPISVALASGAGIGLLSGILGIGGGIFLSPLIVMAGWGTPKQAAATASGFIFVNSLSGLVGRIFGGSIEIGLAGLALIPLGLLGAVGGSQLGARYLSGYALRRLLGVILAIAVLRFWINYFF